MPATAQPFVFEARFETLQEARAALEQCLDRGITSVVVALRDSRDAMALPHLIEGLTVTVVSEADLASRAAAADDLLTLTAQLDLVVVRRPRRPGARPSVVVAIIVPELPDSAWLRQQVAEAVANPNLRVILVANDIFILHALVQFDCGAECVLPSEFSEVLVASGASWVHTLAPNARLADGHGELVSAVAARTPSHAALVCQVHVVMGMRHTGVTYVCDGPHAQMLGADSGLLLAGAFVPLRLVAQATRTSTTCASIISRIGGPEGLLGTGPVEQVTSVGANAVHVELWAELNLPSPEQEAVRTELGSTGSRLRTAKDEEEREAQDEDGPAAASLKPLAKFLVASHDRARIIRETYKVRAVSRAITSSDIDQAIGRPLQAFFERWAEACDELGSKQATAAADDIRSFFNDIASQLEALSERTCGLGLSLPDAVDRSRHLLDNPAAAARLAMNGDDDIIADYLSEGLIEGATLRCRRRHGSAFDDIREARRALLAALRHRTAGRILVGLAHMAPPSQDTIHEHAALEAQRRGEHVRALGLFAARYLSARTEHALAGVVFNLCRIGQVKAAERIVRYAFDVSTTEDSLFLNLAFDLVVTPATRGERPPEWLLALRHRFAPSHMERLIHRLLDAGLTAEAAAEIDRLDLRNRAVPPHLRSRLLSHVGDWPGLVSLIRSQRLDETSSIRDIATALAHVGDPAAVRRFLSRTPIDTMVATQAAALADLRHGRETEAISGFETVAAGAVAGEGLEAKRELIARKAVAENDLEAYALLQDFLQAEPSAEVRSFFAGRYFEASGLCAAAIPFYRDCILGLQAPNWLRTIAIYLLHRCLHYAGRHAEALSLVDPFLKDNGSFGCVQNEEYLQLRQTMLVLNGVRTRGSLRSHELDLVTEPVHSDAQVERSIAEIAAVRAEHPRAAIVIIEFQTGDAYILLFAFRLLKEKLVSEGHSGEIVVICPDRLKGIVSMFGDRVDHIVTRSFVNYYAVHRALEDLADDQIFIGHPEFLTFDRDGKARTRTLAQDFLLQSKAALGLPVNHDGHHPAGTGEARQRGSARKATGDRVRVFLAPMSNSFAHMPARFWQQLAARLVSVGCEVLINKGPEGSSQMPGVTEVDLPHAALVEFLDGVDLVIALRSGLLDVVSATQARMAVLYPLPSLNMPWPHIWTMRHFVSPERLKEFYFLSQDIDPAHMIDDLVAHAQSCRT
jgi:hypothetical protein